MSTLAITHSSRSCKAFGVMLHYVATSIAAWLLVDAHYLRHQAQPPQPDHADGGRAWTLPQYAGFATVVVGVCPIVITAIAAADTGGGHQYGNRRANLCWIDFEDDTLYAVSALPLIALAVATAAMHAATVHASLNDNNDDNVVPSRLSAALWARVPFYLAVSVAWGMLYPRQFGTSSAQQYAFAVLNVVSAVWFVVVTLVYGDCAQIPIVP